MFSEPCQQGMLHRVQYLKFTVSVLGRVSCWYRFAWQPAAQQYLGAAHNLPSVSYDNYCVHITSVYCYLHLVMNMYGCHMGGPPSATHCTIHAGPQPEQQ